MIDLSLLTFWVKLERFTPSNPDGKTSNLPLTLPRLNHFVWESCVNVRVKHEATAVKLDSLELVGGVGSSTVRLRLFDYIWSDHS